MAKTKNIYFLSDAHLGVPDHASSLARERKLVDWLQNVSKDAEAIYLLGDIFDFWFEYKQVVPRGFVRLFGTIARLTDQGLPVYFFPGNHDLWVGDYFEKEMGMKVYHDPLITEYNGKKFYIAHGDGLGKGDYGYKMLKKIFKCRLCQWIFARLHPNFAIGIARYFSRKSRVANGDSDERFLGEEKEYLIGYAKEILAKEHFDYFIFGHRHLPLEIKVNENSTYFNLGEWFKRFTYGVFNGETMQIRSFGENEASENYR